METEEVKKYVIAWSFNNPTKMFGVAVGKNEEDALKDVLEVYGKAPEFHLDDIHEATEEELLALEGGDYANEPRTIN